MRYRVQHDRKVWEVLKSKHDPTSQNHVASISAFRLQRILQGATVVPPWHSVSKTTTTASVAAAKATTTTNDSNANSTDNSDKEGNTLSRQKTKATTTRT